MATNRTLVSFCLDETGSMMAYRDETIDGFNNYVQKLRDENNPIEFTLVKFDSNKIEKVCVGVPVSEVPTLSHQNYQPGAATPLIDAAMKVINATEKQISEQHGNQTPNVVIVIQTDGLENASTEFKFSDLTTKIKDKREAGWQFVFLGAEIDAFDTAKRFGIDLRNTMSYKGTRSRETFAAAGQTVADYAVTQDAASLHFSDNQRSAAGDEHYHKYKQEQPSAVDDLDFTSKN